MVYNNVLDAVGNTPMVRLNRMVDEDSAEILVKFEAVNVGGSIKTRTALNMIEDAEEKGIIKEDTIIVVQILLDLLPSYLMPAGYNR